MSKFLDELTALDKNIADRWKIRTHDKEKVVLSAADIDFILADVIQARQTLHPTRIEIRIEVKPEFGGYRHLIMEGSEGFAHKFFIQKRAVDLGGIEECYAAFYGCAEDRGHLLLIFWRAVGKAHSHATESDSRDFQIAVSKFALLHFWTPMF